MIKNYKISIVGKIDEKLCEAWFVGEGEDTVGIPIAAFSNNSFHVARTDMTQLVFSAREQEAKVIVSERNLQSWLGRIIDILPYTGIDIKEIRIMEVENE